MQLFDRRGGHHYDELVTQTEHAVQCASAAVADRAPDPMVVAALFHDLGHLLLDDIGSGALDDTGAYGPTRDLCHEEVAARFLANWFGVDVTGPIRGHVAAKRYLCAGGGDYVAALSKASRHSLELQGGVMSPDEVAAFERTVGHVEAVAVRRWDDMAKVADRVDPPIRHFAPVVRRVVRFAR